MTSKHMPLFEKFVIGLVVHPSGCLLWSGTTSRDGYGRFYTGKRTASGARERVRAHRWLYEHKYGKQPRDVFICHTCDNPLCVNPSHLFAGSASDNSRDMSEKGRARGQSATHCGKGHPLSGENLRFRNGKQKRCVTCNREADRRYYANKKLRS